ncbi:hypothetical protein ACUOA8_54245, partial [Escherichia sp. SS-MK2]
MDATLLARYSARYTFSFGHYFDPKLLGYASLRVLN